MWADILTKPKQGKSFQEFPSKLMNVPIDIPITATSMTKPPEDSVACKMRKHESEPDASAQECVEVRTKSNHGQNKPWPTIYLGGKLWDPNKYVKLIMGGITRRLACDYSFI